MATNNSIDAFLDGGNSAAFAEDADAATVAGSDSDVDDVAALDSPSAGLHGSAESLDVAPADSDVELVAVAAAAIQVSSCFS